MASDAPGTPEYAYFQNQMISDPAKLAQLTSKTAQLFATAQAADERERIRCVQQANAATMRAPHIAALGLGANATQEEINKRQVELDAAKNRPVKIRSRTLR